jgi:hypothetical protein
MNNRLLVLLIFVLVVIFLVYICTSNRHSAGLKIYQSYKESQVLKEINKTIKEKAGQTPTQDKKNEAEAASAKPKAE